MRELSHVIERAVLWSQGSELDAEHLSLTMPDRAVELGQSGKVGAREPDALDLTGAERALIERALAEADGNQTRAAQLLGISRDTLRYRLKKYGIAG